jgi:hypothetical protein
MAGGAEVMRNMSAMVETMETMKTMTTIGNPGLVPECGTGLCLPFRASPTPKASVDRKNTKDAKNL